MEFLVHSLDQLIDKVLPVSKVSSFYEVVALLAVSTTRTAELEGPQEVVHLPETFAYSEDLMDHILHTDDLVLAKGLLNNFIVIEGYALAVDFAKSTLVDQFSYRLQIWVSPCDVWFNQADHVECCLVEADKGGIVNLSQTKKT